jgi:hypothetical protein
MEGGGSWRDCVDVEEVSWLAKMFFLQGAAVGCNSVEDPFFLICFA